MEESDSDSELGLLRFHSSALIVLIINWRSWRDRHASLIAEIMFANDELVVTELPEFGMDWPGDMVTELSLSLSRWEGKGGKLPMLPNRASSSVLDMAY